MAMHYYKASQTSNAAGFVCNGCGAVTAYYRQPSALFYGI